VTDGPPLQRHGRFLTHLQQALPRLFTAQDARQIELRLTDDALLGRLHEIRTQLMTPEGWWTKQTLQSDPLQLWHFAAGHLRQLNPFAGADLAQTAFVSQDGRHRLLMVDTDVVIADLTGSVALLDRIDQAIKATVAPSILATVVSGHAYTVANAQTVQRDIRVVFTVASVAILVIFILLLRNLRALWVFVLPASVLGIAAGMVALWFPALSGITLGFGAVLLGITVDFTLHVFFALRHGGAATVTLNRLSRPLIGSALTSFMAFAVLLYSHLPGQRQLAVFSMTAIAAALLLALVVMPHLCGRSQSVMARSREEQPHHKPGWTFLWLIVVALCGLGCPQVQFDGDLRSLSVQSQSLDQGEQLMKQVWGDVRSQTLIFATGATVDDALMRNSNVAALVAEEGQSDALVSLATLIPADDVQLENVNRWQQFWTEHQESLERFLRLAMEQGFSASAFDPFLHELKNEPAPLDLSFWRDAGLATVVDGLLVDDLANGKAILSLLHHTAGQEALQTSLESIDGVRVVDQGRFRQQLSTQVGADFSRFILRALLVVVIVLVVWYRRLSDVLLALLPVACGLLAMFGLMGWFGLPFNLFNVIAAILVVGLGVDYGIFMLNRCHYGRGMHTDQAVLVSALTTLAGFGSLTLARHPAMSSIGLTVLFGISTAVITALLVIPSVYVWAGRQRRS
jgi:predicted exporter